MSGSTQRHVDLRPHGILAQAGLALVLCGCELSQSLREIADVLGSRERETVEEAEPVIEGTFRSLRFDGNNADGVFVVALEARDDELERLVLVPFPESEGECSAGPANRYGAAVSRPGREASALEARIPFVMRGSGDAPNALRFTNFRCELDDVAVPDSSLPLNSDFADQPGFIAQTGGDTGDLYFVDPWADEKTLLVEEAAVIARNDLAMFAQGADGPWMWTLESGRVVARDSSFRVRGRAGQDVDQVQHSASGAGGPMIAYHQASGEVYTALTSDLSERELIESDACSIALGSGMNGRRLLYYSPCAARDLVSYELETKTRRVIAEGIAGYRVVGDRSDGPVVMYVTNETGSGSIGTLWARFGEQTPIRIGEQGHLGLSRLSTTGEVKAVLDWGENGGTLMAGDLGSDLDQVAEDVIYYSGIGIIADWNGLTGTLYDFVDDDFERIQRNVSTRGIRFESSTKRGLVLVDYDGEEGELTLIRDGRGTALSKNVRPDSYQFTVQLPTVTILSDLDPETGTATLKLRETDREAEHQVDVGVSEVLEVSWPKAGLLYSVPFGERAGIWFSEAR